MKKLKHKLETITEIVTGKIQDVGYDWFLFDEGNQQVVRHSNGQIIGYGNFDEAFDDRHGNEKLVQWHELPQELRMEYIKQEI